MYEAYHAMQWVEAYGAEKGHTPRDVQQLCSFVKNRGGQLTYRDACTALRGLQHDIPVPDRETSRETCALVSPVLPLRTCRPRSTQCSDTTQKTEQQASSPQGAVIQENSVSSARVRPRPATVWSGRPVQNNPVAVTITPRASMPRQTVNLKRYVSTPSCLAFSEQAYEECINLLTAGRYPFTDATLERLTSAATTVISQSQVIPPEVSGACRNDAADRGAGPNPAAEFGRDILGNLAPGATRPAIHTEKCSLCNKEPGKAQELMVPDTLCIGRHCSGAFCEPCLRRYFSSALQACRHMVPYPRCPKCRGYVRTKSWARFVHPKALALVEENARKLVSYQCVKCAKAKSLLVEHVSGEKISPKILGEALQGIPERDQQALQHWWLRFSCGEVQAIEGITILEDTLMLGEPGDVDFLERLAQFRVRSNLLLRLIEDPSRRAVLQLAMIRRWPEITSTCCGVKMCFKCKTITHHDGRTCETAQRQRSFCQYAQFCPSCGVAAVMAQGSTQVVCICGEEWTWFNEEPSLSDSDKEA